ncbi:MAG: DUF4388 domain-containing protein [bacterium]
MPDGQIRLKGAVEPGVVAEVMQFLSGRTDRVGYLRVTNTRADGRIWYQDGAIVAAECGPERDNAAIRRILCMKTGEFSFVDASTVPARTIYDDVTTILLECFRQIDEAKDVEPDAPEPASGQPLDTISRPAAPWARQGPNTLGQSAAPPAPSAAKPAAATPAPRPAPPAATHKPYTYQQPRTHLRKWVLTTVALIALVVSGALLWWVLNENRRPGSNSNPDVFSEAQPTVAGSPAGKFSWNTLRPARPPPPAAPAMVWPSIRLGGIIAVPGKTASAIINGRFVMEGQPVEGVLLETVTRTGIVLRSGEHTLFVSERTMGQPDESAVRTNTVTAVTNGPPSVFAGFRSLIKRIFD